MRAGALEWCCQALAQERRGQEVEMQETSTPTASFKWKAKQWVGAGGTWLGPGRWFTLCFFKDLSNKGGVCVFIIYNTHIDTGWKERTCQWREADDRGRGSTDGQVTGEGAGNSINCRRNGLK